MDTSVLYGISTHLYHDCRLTRDHLAEIAAHGFDRVEVFATRTHFDYHDPRAIDTLGRDLSTLGLTLHSVHAPIVEGVVDGRWGRSISVASSDRVAREQAVRETRAAIDIARTLPYEFLVLHLGVPDELRSESGPNSPEAVERSLEELAETTTAAGVRLAIELIPNDLSRAEALVRIVEDEIEGRDSGICLDFGHAGLMGDVLDAVETVSGLLVTTHVHDNRGREDDHLVPFEGIIDWPSALTAVQKIGYEGALMFEVANVGGPAAVLARARDARDRFDGILGDQMR